MNDTNDDPTLLSRIASTMKETGIRGITRRTTRVALKWLSVRLAAAERQLFYLEAHKRLSSVERAAGVAAAGHFRERHRGRPAFVVGTGPSVRSVPLSILSPHVTFGVNSLFLHRDFEKWSPTYYCLMDDHFFQPTPAGREFAAKAMGRIGQATQFIVPGKHVTAVRQYGFPPPSRTWFVPMDGALNERTNLEIRPEEIVPYASNAVLFALTMAVLAGASPIILLGAEHNWLAEKAGVDPSTPHFHDERLSITQPNAVKAAWNPFDTYLRTMKYCTLVWESYEVLLNVARRNGIQIVNATPNSFLDVFPCQDLAAVMATLEATPARR